MQVRDFIAVTFPQDDSKAYYAEVRKVNTDGSIECRFVHSGSVYTFKQFSGWLEVLKTTGLFKVGSRTNEVVHYTQTNEAYAVGGIVAVGFDDGKNYLGKIEKLSPLEITFIHSGNGYSFDADKVAHHAGSPYDGRKALEIRTYSAGRNLFSRDKGTTLSLSIIDNFGKPLRGEFEARIKRIDSDEVLYENHNLRAEESHAFDNFEIRSTDGQKLILMVDFHPAMMPYEPGGATTSSMIDDKTSISGTRTFTFKNSSALDFGIKVQNDVSSVTSSTSTEAVKTVHKEVTKNHSHSSAVTLEGEASVELFGIVTLGGGGGHTSTTEDGSGSSEGESGSTGTGTGTSTTYNVYYPAGLEITPNFN